jgi:hypothetical protein
MKEKRRKYMRTLIGLYDQLNDVHRAIEALDYEGFPHDSISMVAADVEGVVSREINGIERGDEDYDESDTPPSFSEVLGKLKAVQIEDALPVVVAGPLTAGLAGPDSSGLSGLLRDLGIPEEDIRVYLRGVRRGGGVVLVNTDERYSERAAVVMNRHNPVDVDSKLEEMGVHQGEHEPVLPVTGGHGSGDEHADAAHTDAAHFNTEQDSTDHPDSAQNIIRSYLRNQKNTDYDEEGEL